MIIKATLKIALIRPHPSIQKLAFYNSQEIGLAKALCNLGINVDVILVGEPNVFQKDTIYQSEHTCVNKVVLPHVRLPSLDLARFPNIEKFLSAQNYDFIHINEFNEFPTYQVAKFCNKSGTPFVFYQGMYKQFEGRAYTIYQTFFNLICRRTVINNAKLCLAKTTYAERYLHDNGFENTKVMPVGLDTQNLNIEGAHSKDVISILQQIPTDHNVVLYVGNFEPRRNIDLLVCLAEKFKDSAVTFIYVGDGELYTDAKTQQQENSLNNLILPGKILQEQLSAIYQRADVFLLASDYEIYGMVLLEAMYFKTAVLSSLNAGSIDLINQDVGKIIDSKTLEDWVQGLKEMLGSKSKLNEMGQAAQNYINSHMLWDKVAARYKSEVLDPLVGRQNET